MKLADLIVTALADGVTLRLDSGKLKVMGDAAVVNRWLPLIREHKVDLMVALAGESAPAIPEHQPDAAKPVAGSPDDLTLKIGASDTAMVEPFDREAFEERAAICEFGSGLTRADTESLAWREDDRRRCTQCLNRRPHDGVCRIAEPKAGALVVANRSYTPDPVLPRRCEGYAPKASDTDQRPGAERWPGLIQRGGE